MSQLPPSSIPTNPTANNNIPTEDDENMPGLLHDDAEIEEIADQEQHSREAKDNILALNIMRNYNVN